MGSRAQEALTVEELEALIAAVTTRGPSGRRNLALVTLLADTGLRIGEALALETRDVVREAGQIVEVKVRSRKGGDPQDIELTRRAAVALAQWLEAREELEIGSGAVFCTVSRGRRVHPTRGEDGFDASEMTTSELTPGDAISASYVRQLLKRLAERAEIGQRVTPHTLRHTFATHLLQDGVSLELVRQALGHKDIATTADIYSHVTNRDVGRAVKRMRGEDEEAEELAAQVLTSLPPAVKRAMIAQLKGEE